MKRYWYLIVLALSFGCVVNPQPEPSLRPVDVERLLLSSPDDDRFTVVAGHGGAAPGAGFIVVRHLGSDTSSTTTTADEGSFSATIEADAGDEIGLLYRNNSGVESEEVTVTIPGSSETLEPPALDPLSPPDRFGLVVLSGGPGAVATDTEVVATNLDQPSMSNVMASEDGSFVLDIVGAANETVAVFVVDAADRTRASAPVTAQIPELEPSDEDCLNGVDDDGDTFTDCDDPDCEDFCRCPEGMTFCDGLCTNTDTDTENCGRCGRICPLTEPNCISGDCVR